MNEEGSKMCVSDTLCGHEHDVDVGCAFQVESPLPAVSAAGGRGVHGLEMYAL